MKIRTELYRMVTNLITNAIKFTFKGEIRFGFEVRKEYIDFFNMQRHRDGDLEGEDYQNDFERL